MWKVGSSPHVKLLMMPNEPVLAYRRVLKVLISDLIHLFDFEFFAACITQRLFVRNSLTRDFLACAELWH